MSRRLIRWFTRRLGGDRFAGSVLDKVFPTHWSFLLGEIILYSFVVLIGTGVYLTLFFNASGEKVPYQGSYEPLQGTEVTQAYQSVMDISLEVRGGLLIRQMHHWAALLFVAAILAHLCRVYFTGAFRRPREFNWVIGVTLFVLALAMGFTGYSMPGDLLSGLGLRIAYSIAQSIPLVGTWLTFLVFGGEWPVEGFVTRLYPLHILVIPLLLLGMISAHLAILWRQKHTDFAGQGRTESNIAGERLFPGYAVRSLATFSGVVGVVALLGGLAQINPVWLYGPYDPAAASSGSQPDWYIGFLEGALRLMPPWEIRAFGHTVPNPFFPGVILPGIMFTLLYAVPYLHRRVTGDRAEHHVLDRPRDAPWRTAIGIAAITFYLVLMIAGAQDVFAAELGIAVGRMRLILQVLLIIGPAAAGWLALSACRALRKADDHPARGPVGAVLRRNTEGGFDEVHDQ